MVDSELVVRRVAEGREALGTAGREAGATFLQAGGWGSLPGTLRKHKRRLVAVVAQDGGTVDLRVDAGNGAEKLVDGA